MRKGFVPVYALIVVAVFILVGAGVGVSRFWDEERTDHQSILIREEGEDKESNSDIEISPVATKLAQNSGTTPTLIPSPEAQPTSTPSPTPKPKHRCEINYTEASSENSADLSYAFIPADGTSYMTKARWDFDADGAWDTDLSQSNGYINHTFPSGGTHTVKLQLEASDGSLTDVCTKTITITPRINVSVSGLVFSDNNCDKSLDIGESGISGVTVNIFKNPEWALIGTVTTDESGYYNFSKTISNNESLSIISSAVAAPGYKGTSSLPPSIAGLSKSFTHATINHPLIPNSIAGVGQCF